ncbi:MAG TPA: hypothetical protein VFK38_06295 [Candidatus Limnocylindrales bacterium]|nr:hypothetical protein [Candidatus Limnocylindrales bacterium]
MTPARRRLSLLLALAIAACTAPTPSATPGASSSAGPIADADPPELVLQVAVGDSLELYVLDPLDGSLSPIRPPDGAWLLGDADSGGGFLLTSGAAGDRAALIARLAADGLEVTRRVPLSREVLAEDAFLFPGCHSAGGRIAVAGAQSLQLVILGDDGSTTPVAPMRDVLGECAWVDDDRLALTLDRIGDPIVIWQAGELSQTTAAGRHPSSAGLRLASVERPDGRWQVVVRERAPGAAPTDLGAVRWRFAARAPTENLSSPALSADGRWLAMLAYEGERGVSRLRVADLERDGLIVADLGAPEGTSTIDWIRRRP